MNILLCLAHAIEEYDQLKLLRSLGHDVWSIGSYIGGPVAPHDPKRPALPELAAHDDLRALVDAMPGDDKMDAAKRHLPDGIIDWADVIIVHHFEHTWLVPQWERLCHKRVIWRTVGQSVEHNERMMAPLRAEGLQIVRYSPKERNIPGYAGEDALIRFYKDPAEWYGWTGEWPGVINITQHLRQRDPYTNGTFWREATVGLARPMGGLPEDGPPPPFALSLGPGSDVGELTYDEMQGWLRRARCYLYTGTQPASYTLGLIEAMMTGIPIVSIGPAHMGVFPYGPDLFEGAEIAGAWSDDPRMALAQVMDWLNDSELAENASVWTRRRAIELFGIDTIRAQWDAFLG